MKDPITTAMVDEVFRRETQKLDSVSRFKGLLTESASCEGTSEYMEGAIDDTKEKIADMIKQCSKKFSDFKRKEVDPIIHKLTHIKAGDVKDAIDAKVVKPIHKEAEKKKKALRKSWKKLDKKLAKSDCETIMKDYGKQIAVISIGTVGVAALTAGVIAGVASGATKEVDGIISDYMGFADELANDVKNATAEEAKEVAEVARDFQKSYEKIVDDQIKAVKDELDSYCK